jgi:YD repeat-containing protein
VIGDDPGDIHTKVEADGGDFGHAAGIGTGCATQREWQVVYDRQGRLREDNDTGEIMFWADSLREGREWLAGELERRARQ